MYFVYILECRDGSFYVGSTHDVAQRVAVHQVGKGPAFTSNRLPVRLVHQESFETLQDAIRRERQLKGWSRAKKAALVSGDLNLFHELAECRNAKMD